MIQFNEIEAVVPLRLPAEQATIATVEVNIGGDIEIKFHNYEFAQHLTRLMVEQNIACLDLSVGYFPATETP